MLRLARGAAARRRVSAQSLKIDLGTAVRAVPVGARIDSSERILELFDLPHVARDFGLSQIDKLTRARLVGNVGYRTGKVAVALLSGPCNVFPRFFQEFSMALRHRAFQDFQLRVPQCSRCHSDFLHCPYDGMDRRPDIDVRQQLRASAGVVFA